MTSTLQITAVHQRVSDLARSLAFYTRQLGFVIVRSSPDQAELSVATGAPALLTLTGGSTAPTSDPAAAGLFHAALLFPSRPALGAWFNYAVNAGVAFEGSSDHGVSEALYFHDPDGNGLEFYCDRPSEAWPRSATGELAMTTARLDLSALLAAAAPLSAEPLTSGLPSPAHTSARASAPAATPPPTRWGHLHLRVTDLARSEAFYRTTLGLSLTQDSYPGARFLATDGYHHHLGLNTWGRPRAPRSPSALGLIAATFAHRGATASTTVTDPDGIALHITPSP